MKIAIVGCAHGKLDQIYDNLKRDHRNEKIDLVICCGDFQAARNESDLQCMAVPPKYRSMGSFYKYYSGEKQAPVLTLFIGGNHEASNFMQELPYGGWVAPKIYYMGYAAVIRVGPLRIGGLSGIHKPFDFDKGHHERAPYEEGSLRSVYHIRNIEVFRLKQVSGVMDIMLSHDWPQEVYNSGCIKTLLMNKPYFKREVDANTLGNKPCKELLDHLKPNYWFAAHLHTKFSALVDHKCKENPGENRKTAFLALDKCLPRRKYHEIIDIPSDENNSEIELYYDLEWLTILHLTDHLMSSRKSTNSMPNSTSSGERWMFTPTEDEKNFVLLRMNNDLKIPLNFERTARCYEYNRNSRSKPDPPKAIPNPQTEIFCRKLGIRDPIGGFENMNLSSYENSQFSTPEKANFSSFISFSDSPRESSGASMSSQNDGSTEETGGDDSSQNERSFENSINDVNNSFSSADYFSFIDNPSLSNRPASTPVIQNKRKYDFPSYKEPDNEDSADSTPSLLPIQIDRAGNTSLIKRRNANIYQEED
ncbi:lariat debranching enzyme B isoform X1 [Planococcus citri]|uniref:lariat debranching enzyme B isoform X1 n=2 Tax=Planococcus citri TaxID=170843 RepID=UPI0031F9EF4E